MAIKPELFPDPPPGTRPSSEIRKAWGSPPPEVVPRVPFTFWDGATVPGGIHRDILRPVQALDEVFHSHGYSLHGEIGDEWCYNRRAIKGTNTYSLHSWAIALDINATTNPYSTRFVTDMTPQMIADVQAIKTTSGRPVWAWGGHWGKASGSKFDPMHFQLNLTPAESVAFRNAPAPLPVPPVPDPPQTVEIPPEFLPPVVTPVDEPSPYDELKADLDRVNRKLDLALDILGGADTRLLLQWMWRTIYGHYPTDDVVNELVARVKGGASLAQIRVDLYRERDA